MPQTRTPVESEPTKNPFITTGIRKTLLTPCRQVGLSRKRKTPNSASHSFSDNPIIISSGSLDTTPLSSNSVQESKSQTNSGKEKDKKKRNVSKRLMDEGDSNLENFSKKQCVTTTKLSEVEDSTKTSHRCHENVVLNTSEKDLDVTKTEKKPKELKSKTAQKNPKTLISKIRDDKKINKSVDKDLPTINEEKYFEKIVSPKKLKSTIKIKPQKKSITDSNNEEDSIPLSDLKVQVIEEVKKSETRISENKDLVFIDNSELGKNKRNSVQETKDNTLHCDKFSSHNQGEIEIKQNRDLSDHKENTVPEGTALLTLSSVSHLHEDHFSKSINEQKTKKIKRSLSLKKSSGDFKIDGFGDNIVLKECSVDLSSLDNVSNYLPKVSCTEVKEIEKQIKQKRKLVEELKQAEIYQKKHDLKELGALTDLWKKGCISALNDLLPQLQTHATINMETLLKNLNIPKESVGLTEDGQLI